ncbi:hypothetical protein TRM7615_04964 [Falsiruegeria mediterranea M17]|uniref:Uncharacterized protein n=1 Tax=Falsiruegeria mediterranea M17 TaxID=1200281 RepID=A0A2R8CG72_9RHOB|nr:hypothetical protein TRM7615_04964 [Falsiruegeria mediterranea M17]
MIAKAEFVTLHSPLLLKALDLFSEASFVPFMLFRT